MRGEAPKWAYRKLLLGKSVCKFFGTANQLLPLRGWQGDLSQRRVGLPINQLDIVQPVVGVDAADTFPNIRRDGPDGTLGITVLREFRDFIQREAISINWATTLAGPDERAARLEYASGTTVETNVRGNRVGGMELPFPCERV